MKSLNNKAVFYQINRLIVDGLEPIIMKASPKDKEILLPAVANFQAVIYGKAIKSGDTETHKATPSRMEQAIKFTRFSLEEKDLEALHIGVEMLEKSFLEMTESELLTATD